MIASTYVVHMLSNFDLVSYECFNIFHNCLVTCCFFVKWCIFVSDMSMPGSLEVVVVDGAISKSLSSVLTPNTTPGLITFHVTPENAFSGICQSFRFKICLTYTWCISPFELIFHVFECALLSHLFCFYCTSILNLVLWGGKIKKYIGMNFYSFAGSTRKNSLGSDRGSRRRKGGLRTLPFDVTSMEDLPTDSRPPVSPRPSSPLSGEDYMDHHDIIPGSRVRPRRARKAVRRSKSALDARPKLRLSENDPREPPVPRVDRTSTRAPWTGRPRSRGRGRARQMSLPENTYLDESDRVIGLHQVSPDPQADVCLRAPFQTGVAFSTVPLSRQHSSSVSPEGSINLSPPGGSAGVPTSDSSDKDQKSNTAEIPHVQFRIKKSRTANSKPGKDNKISNNSAESAIKTKAMLNEPLSSDTGGELEENSVNNSNCNGRTSTLETQHKPRTSQTSVAVQSTSSCTPTLTPSTSRSVTPLVFQTPEGSKTCLSKNDASVSSAIVLSDESDPSSPKAPRPHHLDLAGDTSKTKKSMPSGSVSFDETLSSKCERMDSVGKGKSKRESTSFFKIPSLFKKTEDKDKGSSSLPQSQQSSIVGLDWLFSTDSDSPSSGN